MLEREKEVQPNERTDYSLNTYFGLDKLDQDRIIELTLEKGKGKLIFHRAASIEGVTQPTYVDLQEDGKPLVAFATLSIQKPNELKRLDGHMFTITNQVSVSSKGSGTWNVDWIINNQINRRALSLDLSSGTLKTTGLPVFRDVPRNS